MLFRSFYFLLHLTFATQILFNNQSFIGDLFINIFQNLALNSILYIFQHLQMVVSAKSDFILP